MAKGNKKVAPVWGADPEMFAGYRDSEGELHVYPPVMFRTEKFVEFEENGDHPIFMRVGDVKIHEDGGAFEMSLLPDLDWRTLFDRINSARIEFEKEFLAKYPDDVEPKLFQLPSMRWEVDRWITMGEDFAFATRFGCDPDEDAFAKMFGVRRRSSAFDASRHPWRYAGGHIHVSGVEQFRESPLIAIRCLAMTAGLAATAYSDVPDLERERTFRYGLPGKFRVQRYGKLFDDIPFTDIGIEYRTPSVRWTADRTIAEQVFTWAEVGIKELFVGGAFSKLSDEAIREGARSIVEADQEAARGVLDYVKGVV